MALTLSVVAFHFGGLGDPTRLSLPTVIAISAGCLCLLGAYDDLANMRAHWKLLGQIAAVIPVVLAGYYVERVTLLGFPIELGRLGIVWTIAWLILGINALNLIDGMDGLATVVGIVISVAIATIAGSQGLSAVMLPTLALAGALAGFAVYNLPPARVYLGDCGSMVIGLVLSLSAMQVSLDGPGSVNLTVITALLFVPLLDTALAIVRRVLSGRGIMTADRGHIHHGLLDRGFNTWSVLALLGGLSLLTGAAAWLMTVVRCEIWMWGALGAVTAALVNRKLVGHKEWAIVRQLWSQSPQPTARGVSAERNSAQPEVAEHTTAERTMNSSSTLPETVPLTSDEDTCTTSKRKAA
ncbi:MAG: undecaprenyl/decaprenyl-phosphate alpha-N-acetylglucosaminyl 1-phosphate transferase [Planctomycetes bacterium]|nr:undecaprenyl/decaprenyl-phosphate alpha-N-acetylglucosaminyl 1-phosphate transferase [Planctomycetota bacterium]